MSFTIGELFAGYGGLGLGVQAALGGEVVWHSEYEPATEKHPHPTQAPARILAHHWPEIPNLGDITTIDWANVEPVDIICGGSPCQDVSAAGRRAGMRPGTRSGLWESMREGIAVLRPRLVIWENVRGVTSAQAHSDLAAGSGLLGPADRGTYLRTLGRVLGDLADCGYDAQWHGLRAADIGAPHGRFRIFVVRDLPDRNAWAIIAHRLDWCAHHDPHTTEKRPAMKPHDCGTHVDGHTCPWVDLPDGAIARCACDRAGAA